MLAVILLVLMVLILACANLGVTKSYIIVLNFGDA